MDARAGLGRVGNAGSMNFAGVVGTPNYIDTGVSTDISQTDFSIAFFCKFSGSQLYGITQAKTIAPIASNFIIPYAFEGAGNYPIFWMRLVILGDASTIDDGEWHHLVMAWNKTTEKYKGYVDGDYIGESNVVSGYSAGVNIILGIRGDKNNATPIVNFFGKENYLKIYQRQINANEVKLLSQGLPISRSNLLLEYNLNKIIDVDGTLITPDTSGNGNDGTVTGAVITTDKPF